LKGLFPEGTTFYHGEGCEGCNGTGFQGTTGIFEVVAFDDEFRGAILRSEAEDQLRALLKAKGVKSLLGSGIDKVVQGITTPSEVIRVTGGKVD
jgi:type II secretory ATPase GspE/PulE/Tfp pilus assembly ATPase PilB-like protein